METKGGKGYKNICVPLNAVYCRNMKTDTKGENMVQRIDFRYNRHNSTLSLILLLGLIWVIEIFLQVLLTHIIGLQNGMNAIPLSELSPFWQAHSRLALVVSFLPLILMMIFSVSPVARFWRYMMDAEGYTEIYDGYAILHFKSKEVRISQSTDISHDFVLWGKNGSMGRFHPVTVMYIIRNGRKKYHLLESLREMHEKTSLKQRWNKERIPSSLTEALDEVVCTVW